MFRQRIYKVKKQQDEAALAVDIIQDRDELKYKRIDIEPVNKLDETIYRAEFYFGKKPTMSFKLISVEENPDIEEEDGGANVSKDLDSITS